MAKKSGELIYKNKRPGTDRAQTIRRSAIMLQTDNNIYKLYDPNSIDFVGLTDERQTFIKSYHPTWKLCQRHRYIDISSEYRLAEIWLYHKSGDHYEFSNEFLPLKRVFGMWKSHDQLPPLMVKRFREKEIDQVRAKLLTDYCCISYADALNCLDYCDIYDIFGDNWHAYHRVIGFEKIVLDAQKGLWCREYPMAETADFCINLNDLEENGIWKEIKQWK